MIAVSPPVLWIGFLALLAVCFAVDFWLHRRPREIGVREAARWTAGWVALGVSFAGVVWALLGMEAAGQFLAAYAIEWSLSVDNVFVFVVIIAGLAVPPHLRHKVLFAGALGAILMRLTFILAGSALLHHFEWLIYAFGGLLLIAAVRFLRQGRAEHEDAGGRAGRLLRRFLPLSDSYRGGRLVVVEGGRRLATPLLLALLLVEGTDLLFAVDSIPAVFGMTRDPFVAFSSNALAVLGLRSLYFLVEGGMRRFRYLRPALALILAFVGLKMVATPLLHVPAPVSLAVVVGILAIGILASWAVERRYRDDLR